MNRSTVLSLPMLCAALAGCMTPPPQLDLALSRPTEQARYVVTLQPPAAQPAINQIHSWQVKVASPAGAMEEEYLRKALALVEKDVLGKASL